MSGEDRQSALSALAEGTHGDPFSVLGAHELGGTRTLTVFLPSAETVTAHAGDTAHALTPSAVTGVFEGPIPNRSYTLEAQNAGGQWTFEDPYRFGPVLGEIDEYLLGEGKHHRLWDALGAHVMAHEGVQGTHFAVWAPNASRVSVVGDWNGWDGRVHVMRKRGATGVWEIFLPGIGDGAAYKYEIIGPAGRQLKADPVGFGSQHPPETASVVRDITGYGWRDATWMETRAKAQDVRAPISIYEVHLGSWKRRADGRVISYKEAAEELIDYVTEMGFTHIELLPISEFPFDGSWGYQPVGLYAPTIRYGPPHEFRDLVDAAHAKGIGILLDWVPGHFPTDAHGLGQFDGTALYEHADPKEGFHQDWNTLIYNYGRAEVSNYLVANALYWCDAYHIDGLRVDAVASMLYRDYSRAAGEWIPNKDGGRENYEAIKLLQDMNVETYGHHPGIMTVAEESTSFPRVSGPVHEGGLGFGFKWNMGWMNDTLRYMSTDPVHRKYHHNQMTFGLAYAWSENFILPISHDEVVHGKGSMLEKMPGTREEKFANLRAYYGFMWAHPGKKLLFMGQELAQGTEWNHDASVDWAALDDPAHKGVQRLVRDLNTTYRGLPALHVLDADPAGFEWLDVDDADRSLLAWVRYGEEGDAPAVVLCNFTPVERPGYRVGLPGGGTWEERLNTDAAIYGGGNRGNLGTITAEAIPAQGHPWSAEVYLPPLSVLILSRSETD